MAAANLDNIISDKDTQRETNETLSAMRTEADAERNKEAAAYRGTRTSISTKNDYGSKTNNIGGIASTTSDERGTREILLDNDTKWVRVPYQVVFGDDFASMADALSYAIRTWGNKPKEPNQRAAVGRDKDEIYTLDKTTLQDTVGAPDFIDKCFFKDTCVGGNDAINCVWQFGRDDDIMHPMLRSRPDQPVGEGRVYASTTDLNQSVAYFSFGVPKYTPLADFYATAFNKDMIEANATGITSSNSGYSIARVIGQTATLLFALPVVGVSWFAKSVDRLTDLPINRLYDLRLTMQEYYAYVDRILAEWLVDVGIYANGSNKGEPSGAIWGNSNLTANMNTVPVAMRATGLSIWDIMSRKAKNVGFNDLARNGTSAYAHLTESSTVTDHPTEPTTDDQDNSDSVLYKDLEKMSTLSAYLSSTDTEGQKKLENEYNSIFAKWSGWVGGLVDVMKDTALGATMYVGFRVEKSTDASESFSNSTKTNPLTDTINNAVSSTMTKAQIGGVGAGGDGVGIDIIDNALGGLSNFIKGAADMFGVGGAAEAMISGAFVDAPEMYASSSFSKSHSLNFQLRAPYGTITSIYQSIMVPLALLLAGALPRAAGKNSYMSPFLCRVYCKGLFSVPLGLIESISIKRGSSEFGWTYNNLPTCVDVSISIKDLSPAMYMTITDNTIVGDIIDKGLSSIYGPGNSFNEYLLTLAGVGMFERLSIASQIKRKITLLSHTLRNKYTNSNYWAMAAGDTIIPRIIANLSTANMIPNS